jgi:signal transduction histidine kinase
MGIIQKHGGDIRVESDGINKGATFRVLLPVKKGDAMPIVDRHPGMAA